MPRLGISHVGGLLALAATAARAQESAGEGIWVGSNTFGANPLHTEPHELSATTNKGHRDIGEHMVQRQIHKSTGAAIVLVT
jgi:hypothetical protein